MDKVYCKNCIHYSWRYVGLCSVWAKDRYVGYDGNTVYPHKEKFKNCLKEVSEVDYKIFLFVKTNEINKNGDCQYYEVTPPTMVESLFDKLLRRHSKSKKLK